MAPSIQVGARSGSALCLPALIAVASVICMLVGLLSGCSSVGGGFAHHPVDCAMGIAWADCLPGTAGYNNGGGSLTRADEAKVQMAAINSQQQDEASLCATNMRVTDLDPIRAKVELLRPWDGPAPAFQIAATDSFPNEAERGAIARWATIRDDCIRRGKAISLIPSSATPLSTVIMQQDAAYRDEAGARVGELIVALYQGKLTYGEFAQKRYEIGRDAAAAERQFRQAVAIADQAQRERQMHLAQEQFRNSVLAWSALTQAVSARQAQSVPINPTITTNCNEFVPGQINCTSH